MISLVPDVRLRPAFRLTAKTRLRTFSLAGVFLYEGEPRRVIELVTQAISLDPKHANEIDFQTLGWAYFSLGDNDAAIEWCTEVLGKKSRVRRTIRHSGTGLCTQRGGCQGACGGRRSTPIG